MNKLFFLALAACCGSALAQTATRVTTGAAMPDGSRDTYLGLGAQSAPRWEGAQSRRVSALPVVQVQWSSGVFISGPSLGMHLSDDPRFEYGPLLAFRAGRGEGGVGGLGGKLDGVGQDIAPATVTNGIGYKGENVARNGRLAGMHDIHARVTAGAFANYYLTPRWRLTSGVQLGAGNDRHGAMLELGVQRLAAGIGEHHRFVLSAGVGIANRAYNQEYFGVTAPEASRNAFSPYTAAGGLQNAHAGLRWNWDWTPNWMLTTNLQARRLLGSPRHSPLAERPTNMTVSSAVAYRF